MEKSEKDFQATIVISERENREHKAKTSSINLNNYEDIRKLIGATIVNSESNKSYMISGINVDFDENITEFTLVDFEEIEKIKGVIIDRQELSDKYICKRLTKYEYV